MVYAVVILAFTPFCFYFVQVIESIEY